MNQVRRVVVASAAASVAAVALMPGPAVAVPQPSCVAQQVQVEHEVFGTAWGHDVVAFVASHPEGRAELAELGLRNFGELAAFFATSDRASCPEE